MRYRKLWLVLALAAMLLVSACVAAPVETPVVEQEHMDAAEDDEFEDLVHEYGETESMVDYGEHFCCLLTYPKGACLPLNRALETWATEVLKEYRDYESFCTDQTGDVESELTVHYSAYLVRGRYVGVEELGWYDHSQMAHPSDVIYTANADLEENRLLENDDLFEADYVDRLGPMVKAKLEEESGETVEDEITVDWFRYVVLTDTGITVYLPQGEYLPSAWGSFAVDFNYAQLEGIFKLFATKTAVGWPAIGGAALAATTIDTTKPMVALSFDDGPSKNTEALLDLLKEYGGHATFCVVGNRLETYQRTLRRTVDEGHEMACHTWDHKKLTKLSRDDICKELTETSEKVAELTGFQVRLLRPPYGSVNDDVKAVCKELGWGIALWSIDTLDWKTKNAQSTYDAIMRDVKDGCIILCHDLYQPTAEAMERVIPKLVEQGYQIVSVSELIAAKTTGLEAGKVYHHVE